MDKEPRFYFSIARLLIGIVLFLNLTCAVQFILFPHMYLVSFGLLKENGTPIILGYGVLFLMWNIPYLFAFINPMRFQISLVEAIIMQSIGILGEGWILISLSRQAQQTSYLINRFLYFDTFGLMALVSAYVIVKKMITSSISHKINNYPGVQ